jgi:TetR/AcrR family transcriptional regulator
MLKRDAERRRQILEAAIPVFAAHGLKGATVRLVGRRAGVNSALIYYYYADKEALFFEAVRRVLCDFLEGVASKRPAFTSGADRVRFLVESVFDYYLARPERLRLMGLVFVHHGEVLGSILAAAMRIAPLEPVAILEEGIAAGQIRSPSALQAWWSILGACMFTMQAQNVAEHMGTRKLSIRVPGDAERRSAIIDLMTQGLAAKQKKGRRA